VTLKYLLDTSIVSLAGMERPNRRVVARLEEEAAHCAIAAPVWHELIFGWSRMPNGKRKVAVGAFLNDVIARTLPILKYDKVAAHWHGTERARLEKVGKVSAFVDGQIAAIAHAHSLILVTANTADFENFKNVTVENWSLGA
jgi:tRNA(fMet)-specific endonuclease VapC